MSAMEIKCEDGNLTFTHGDFREEDLVTVWGTPGNYSIFSINRDEVAHKITKAEELPRDFIDWYGYTASPYLQERVTVLISTHSGTHQADKFFDGILKPLLDGLGVAYDVVRTTSSESVKEFAHTLKTNHTVLLLSGDGGVVDILNGIDETVPAPEECPAPYEPPPAFSDKPGPNKPAIVLLPLGSANALFHSTFRGSLPAYVKALRALVHGRLAELPMFKARFKKATLHGKPVEKLYGAVVASYGFHATLVAKSDTPEYRKFGSERFGMVGKELLANPYTYQARARITDMDEKEQVLEGGQYVLAAMVSNLEKSFTVAPDCRPLDGNLYFVHLTDVMEAMGGYQGIMPAKRVHRATIEMLEDVTCCIDGLIVVVEEGGQMDIDKVQESKVDVVIAKEGPRVLGTGARP